MTGEVCGSVSSLCSSSPAFAGFRFPAEVIVAAVRWYMRYGFSYRDVEELLAERGIEVDHATVYRWVQRFSPLLADAARFARHCVGCCWTGGVSRCSRWRPGSGWITKGCSSFVTTSTWDTAAVRARLACRAVEVIDPVAWVFDDTGFPKDGTGSPGVARRR